MDGFILKILNGPQTGAEVILSNGEYSLGSGEDDDLQFNDLSLKHGHARLKVSSGTVEISAGSGGIETANGLKLEADDTEWREVEQLDVISLGMVRFAIGAPTANWTSIIDATSDDGDDDKERPLAGSKTKPSGNRRKRYGWPKKTAWGAAASVGLALALTCLIWLYPNATGGKGGISRVDPDHEFAVVQDAVSELDFAKRINVRQEVDGAIFVSGYVDTLVQRRALINAVNETGAPASTRVWVLDVLRNGLDNLYKSLGQEVEYSLSDTGDLTLRGIILDGQRAKKIERLTRDQVIGLHSVKSEIKSAPGLLEEIRDLAEKTRIGETVLFRLDGVLVEASGVISADKIDLWAGFIESYARNFADVIALRSYVQLADGTPAPGGPLPDEPGPTVAREPAEFQDAPPVIIGKQRDSEGGLALDAGRLAAGEYSVDELFAGENNIGELLDGRRGGQTPDRVARPWTGGSATLPFEHRGPTREPGRRLAERRVGPMLPPLIRREENDKAQPGHREFGAHPRRDDNGEARIARRGFSDEHFRAEAGEASRAPAKDGAEKSAGSVLDYRVIGKSESRPPALGDVGIAAYLASLNLPVPAASPVCGITSSINMRWIDPGYGKGNREKKNYFRADLEYVELVKLTRGLVRAWIDGRLIAKNVVPESIRELNNSIDKLAQSWTESILGRHAREDAKLTKAVMQNLLAKMAPCPEAAPQCWTGSRLNHKNLSATLFWLDLFALSDSVSLAAFQPHNQALVLEAGLNPRRVAACAPRAMNDFNFAEASRYMDESVNNPGVATLIAGQLGRYALAITGVHIGEDRYIQFSDGKKFREGSVPGNNTRIMQIGELGTVMQSPDGIGVSLYDPHISWFFGG